MSRGEVRPGPLNLITDVAGLTVGHAEDHRVMTGATVVLPAARAVAAADVRGGGPGTRDVEALDPTCVVDAVDAIMLSGGSVYGLEAAAGATVWLAAQGRGFAVRGIRVPIVPSAILFDLTHGGDKGWGDMPPYRRLGQEACAAAASTFAQGNAGAGVGAKTATCKGGLGSVSAVDPAFGVTVGALVAANPVGSVVMPDGTFWAWPFERNGEFGGMRPTGVAADPEPELYDPDAVPAGNTTIGVVATDAALTKAEAKRVAMMAQDGLARAIRPVHTPADGDTIFVLATGTVALPEERRATALTRIGAIAADCVARAIARGVWHAESLGRFVSWKARYGR
jgi:L-aminopeptidase/D-esterase-like protein